MGSSLLPFSFSARADLPAPDFLGVFLHLRWGIIVDSQATGKGLGELANLTVTDLFYPVFVIMTLVFTLIFIPRDQYRRYLIYGLLVGGLGDVLAVTLYQNLLKVMWFQNQGLFYVLGHHALSPVAWTLTVMLFLYFLPGRRGFLYPYVLFWAACSLAYGYIVRNARLFDFKDWFYPIPAYLTFLAWWTFAAWFFLKTGRSPDRRTENE